MAHFNSYDSFQTKKSIEKKNKAKESSYNKMIDNSFFKPFNEIVFNYGIVVETSYRDAKVLFDDEIITVNGMIGNLPCNKVVFPGDKVEIDKDKKNIIHIAERKTILSRDHRDSTRNSKITTNKIIATNIDTAVIVVSAFSPPLHPKFIDRYLMILQNCDIEPIICLNKSDLKTDNDEKILEIYRKLGVKVIETSTIMDIGIDELKSVLLEKQSIFVGHSGVGKSTLTNKIMGFDIIRTGEVGEKSKKGRHTTTSSKYYVWNNKSSIIDTPGIRSLDVSSFNADEVETYFQEFNNYLTCKYKGCDHINSPTEDCGIKKAVLCGDISELRYDSYVRIIKDIKNDKKKQNNVLEDDGYTM